MQRRRELEKAGTDDTNWPVVMLDDNQIVVVTTNTMQHIRIRHPEIMLDDFAAVRSLMDSGTRINNREDKIGIAGLHNSRGYIIAISNSNHILGDNRLVSLYRISDKKLKKMFRPVARLENNQIIYVVNNTRRHIRSCHPEITKNDYLAVQTLVNSGIQISDRKDTIGIAGWHQGKGYKIALSKPNHPLGANQLVSLYHVNNRRLRREIEKAEERTAGGPT